MKSLVVGLLIDKSEVWDSQSFHPSISFVCLLIPFLPSILRQPPLETSRRRIASLLFSQCPAGRPVFIEFPVPVARLHFRGLSLGRGNQPLPGTPHHKHRSEWNNCFDQPCEMLNVSQHFVLRKYSQCSEQDLK
jgi:hypothetical protein